MLKNTEQETSTTAVWPQTATYQNSTLIFSGTHDKKRITKESSLWLFRTLGKTVIIVIILLGFAGLVLSACQAYPVKDWWFIFNRTSYNLGFWTATFLAAYLWAQIKEEKFKDTALNLLQMDPDQKNINPAAELDVYEFFNKDAKKTWNNAFNIAKQQTSVGEEIITGSHELLMALLEDKSIQSLFFRLGVNPDDIAIFLRNYHKLQQNQTVVGEITNIPFVAFNESIKLHNKTIDPLMLLCALKITLPENHIIQNIFFNVDVSLEDLENLASWLFSLKLLQDEVKLTHKLARFKSGNEINRGMTSIPTPYLDRFSTDLTLEAKYGALPLAMGRLRDVQEIFNICSDGRKNILIKGEEGSGRTTVVNELAYKMVSEQVPESLADMRLVRLETSAIVGTNDKSESVLIRSLNEAAQSDNIILVLEDVHMLQRVQTASGMSLLETCVNFLGSANLMVISTTTPGDYVDYLRHVQNFDQSFTSYELKQLTTSEIMLACCVRASILEIQNRCFFRFTAIKQAIALTDLYIKNQNQPQKSIAVLVEAASRVKANKNHVVTGDLIQSIISDRTHIPSQTLNEDESEKLLTLENELAKYIIGQKTALTAVSEGLRRARSGLGSENKPLASFLFLGPTGVGKTEVAKTLARIYFGEEKFLLRMDMSEYRGQEGINKLIGGENSKIDSPLVKHIKNNPFCLLLLDELEKASPEILNLFLQILDDGRLTSGKGETVDMTHCLIIATSNAGSADIQTGIKSNETMDHIKAMLMDQVLVKYYPPELLNRFDGVIIFSPLNPDEVEAIAHLQLQSLVQKVLSKGIKLTLSDSVIKDIAQNAYDASLGARPIRRYIQDHLESFVAKLLLQKTLQRGSEVKIDLVDGKFIIK